MPVYYDPQVIYPRVPWSKTVYPHVLRSLEFWLCVAAHAALVVLLHLEYMRLPEDKGTLVPPELAAAVFALAVLATALLTVNCQHWNEAVTCACAQVGEQTRLFAQELQSSLGRVDEVLALRFAAAKYALAGVYLFFFAITGGSVTARAWGELRAKGLLDDREVQFLESQYSGDCIALLHVWAMWAAQEAAADPAARVRVGPEALAGSLARLAEALRAAGAAVREAAGRAAAPVPYAQFQLQGALGLAALLLLAAAAAPAAAETRYVASAAYMAVLVALLGLREAAALLADPLRRDHGFPVAAAVNATADAVAQLLIASSPAVFDPCVAWGDVGHAVFSQGQIERRTPSAAFLCGRANPYHWQEVKPPVVGDQAPPPLLDVGCCHLDVEALPKVRAGRRTGHAYQIARRPRQDAVGALLAQLQVAMYDAKGRKVSANKGGESMSTTDTSSAGSESIQQTARSLTGDLSNGDNDWDAITAKIATVPREHSPASSVAGVCYPGAVGASRAHQGLARLCDGFLSVGGTWANYPEEPRGLGRGGASVSPQDAAPAAVAATGPAAGAFPQRSRTPSRTMPCRA